VHIVIRSNNLPQLICSAASLPLVYLSQIHIVFPLPLYDSAPGNCKNAFLFEMPARL